MYSKEEFENLIDNSPLFSIDKKCSPMQYKTERYVLLTLLTDYYRFYVFKNKPLEDYSLTLIKTAAECIEYYNQEEGKFLHLFNSAMKRNFTISRAKELIDNKRQGIKITSKEDELIRKIIRFTQSKDLDIYDESVQKKVATIIGVSHDKIRELVQMNDNAVGVYGRVTNDEGEEVDLFDKLSSKEHSPEEELVLQDSVEDLINKIEDTFIEIQDRQKQMISLLLTVEIVKVFNYDLKKVFDLLEDKKIYNYTAIKFYETNGDLPTAKHIATICGVSEQSLSRTYKNFKNKVILRKKYYENFNR